MSKVSIRHTLQATAGLLMIVLPLALDAAKAWPKLRYVSAGLGFLVTLVTNAKVVALASTLLDLILPEAKETKSPEIKEVESPIIVKESKGLKVKNKEDSGYIVRGGLLLLMLTSLMFMLFMFSPKAAHAQGGEQRYGGCFTPASYGQFCVGPRAGALITRYDFSGTMNGKFTGGFNPGVGYGIVLQSVNEMTDWKKIELDLFFSTLVGGSATTIPNNVSVTGLLTFFDYISVGVGSQWTEQLSGSAKANIYITGGLSLNIGGLTPSQVAKRKAAFRKELEAAQVAK